MISPSIIYIFDNFCSSIIYNPNNIALNVLFIIEIVVEGSSIISCILACDVEACNTISTIEEIKCYYKVWKEFVEKGCVEELLDYIDDYYRFAENSFINNSYIWGYGGSFSETDAQRAKDWLKTRVEFIYNNLSKYEIDDLINALPGDINCDNAVTIL